MAEPLPSTTPTGDTHDTSPPDETSPTFHLFPKLPTEIRLAIWKCACFPRSQIDHGIQYVTVNIVKEDDEEENLVIFDDNLEGYDYELAIESDEDGYITLTAPKLPFDTPAGPSRLNASACLWDVGLSTVCHESRLAVAEYHNFKGWRELREQPLNLTETNGWYDQAYPSTLIPRKRDKKWCPMVVPLFDIFCIDTSRIKKLPKSLYSMKLLTPFLNTRTFTIKESWNIALKFDNSWNTNFPYQIGRLKSEKTPRGLLANWLDRFQDEVLPEPSVWIIDDSVEWVESPDQKFSPVYRDCNSQYIQIDWHNTRDDGARGDVTYFMKSLGAVLDVNDGFFPFKVKKHIKLLVRKDNEIPWDFEEELELSDITHSEEDPWDPWDEDDDLSDGSGISGGEDD